MTCQTENKLFFQSTSRILDKDQKNLDSHFSKKNKLARDS